MREYIVNMEYIIVRGELLQMTPGLLTVKSIPPLMLQQKQLLVPRKMLMLQHKKFRLTKKIGKLPFQLWVLVNVKL